MAAHLLADGLSLLCVLLPCTALMTSALVEEVQSNQLSAAEELQGEFEREEAVEQQRDSACAEERDSWQAEMNG